MKRGGRKKSIEFQIENSLRMRRWSLFLNNPCEGDITHCVVLGWLSTPSLLPCQGWVRASMVTPAMSRHPLCSLGRVSVRTSKGFVMLQGISETHPARLLWVNPGAGSWHNCPAGRQETESRGLFFLYRPPTGVHTPAHLQIQGPRAWSWKRQIDFITALKISPSCAYIRMDWNIAHVQKNCLSQKTIMTSSSSTADSFPSLSSLFPTRTINMFCLISSSDISGFGFQPFILFHQIKELFSPCEDSYSL